MTKLKYKKIHSLEQYNEYCDIHEELMLSENEEASEEIELLELLIEDYDSRVMKDNYSKLNPVELLKSLLENAGLSQAQFAKEIGVSRQLINDIIGYRRNISKDIVIKMSSYFSMTQEAFSRSYNISSTSHQK